jgi:hypothetical protein
MLDQRTEIEKSILIWFTITAYPQGNGIFPAPGLGERPLQSPVDIGRSCPLERSDLRGFAANQPNLLIPRRCHSGRDEEEIEDRKAFTKGVERAVSRGKAEARPTENNQKKTEKITGMGFSAFY